MGALTPISPWIPEDDLLLKNAVEAGASLESLAKGAVRFSRRFTIREIQERWHSLLYDPDISVDSAKHMIELERSTSSLPINKSSKLEASKDCREGRKRKVKTVRSCYYAIRKRIRSDPLNQFDLGFLVPPVENCYGHGNEAGCPSNILEDPVGSHLEIKNANFDGMHLVCPENIGHNTDGASHEFDNRDKDQLENHPIEQCEEIPQMVHNNMSLGGNSTAVGRIDSLKEISVQNSFEDNIDVNTRSTSDNKNNNNMYPCLEGTHVFNSPVLECEASFQQLQYSSPPEMHEWRNMNSMSAMEMAGDSHLIGKSQDTRDPFGLPDERRKSPSEYDVLSETDFENHIACDEMKASSSCAQYDLVALSDTLLNLSDVDMLLMDDDGTEIDKYGLSNLLLDSPSDLNEDQLLDVTQLDTLIEPEADPHICRHVSTGQLDKGDSSTGQLDTSGQVSVLEEPKLSSASDTKPQIVELCNAVICCTLNTEDLEVPNNDHVVIPCLSPPPSLKKRGFSEISRFGSSIKDNLHKQARETDLRLVDRELKIFTELHTDSQARRPKTGLNNAIERDANLPLPKRPSCSTVIIRKVASESVPWKQPCRDVPKLPVKSSDGLLTNFQTGAVGVKQEKQAVKKLEVNTQLKTAEEMTQEAALEEPFLSDVEEQPSDDEDIPCVSDIESMFHDMDLFPEDLDSYSSRLVAKYQSEVAKRRIIRLEQAAHASTHRTIASHGAFAYLYGRDSKPYYIKKPEVLLGRATEDVLVDIDLGKERRANKISRRQAIIKMDEDGEFHLKNLGKCPILVDDKEVFPGQSLTLHSNCYVQVREMPFKFEKNQARVKQYLDAISRTIPPN